MGTGCGVCLRVFGKIYACVRVHDCVSVYVAGGGRLGTINQNELWGLKDHLVKQKQRKPHFHRPHVFQLICHASALCHPLDVHVSLLGESMSTACTLWGVRVG